MESPAELGVEVFDAEEVTEATERLKAAGLADLVEDESTCCYACQDKVWAVEPDGLRWEWYRVLEDSDSFGERPENPANSAEPETAPGPAAPEATPEASPLTLEGCC